MGGIRQIQRVPEDVLGKRAVRKLRPGVISCFPEGIKDSIPVRFTGPERNFAQGPLIHFLSRENFGSLAVRRKRIHGFASHPCG